MGAVHTFERKELTTIVLAGTLRRIDHMFNGGNYSRWKAFDNWDIDINGAIGEAAVARYLNSYWAPGVAGAPDLPEAEVRTTTRNNGCLILHKENDDLSVFVLVVVNGNTAKIVGWIRGADGKLDQYWRDDDRVQPAFFVPQSALADPAALRRAAA